MRPYRCAVVHAHAGRSRVRRLVVSATRRPSGAYREVPHENDPGPAKRWREMSDHLVWNVMYPKAPDSYHENPKAGPHWEWTIR